MPRLASIILLFCASLAAAQSGLPLEGYYHPGRYMPVMLRGPLPATIRSPDAVPTELPESAGSNAGVIVPVLVLRPSTAPLTIRAGDKAESLVPRPLNDDQILIGYTTPRPPSRSDAFPRRPMVPVRISVEQLSPAIAWTTLDMLVLDESSFRVLRAGAVSDFLAGGVQILVEQEARPAGDLPWRQSGPYWHCSPPRAGPSGAMLDHAYEPTLAWKPSWPTRVRVRVVIAAVVIVVIGVILLLPRRRWAAPAACAYLLAAGALAWLWHARTPPIFQATGTVVVHTPNGLDQHDLWLYQTAARQIDSALPVASFTVPMLYSPDQAQSQQLRLICARDGSPAAFAFRLAPRQRIGFVRRSLSSRSAIPDPRSPIPRPLIAQLAPLYLGPGDTITSIDITPPPGADDFGAILISRPSPPPPASTPGATAPSPAERSGSLPPPT